MRLSLLLSLALAALIEAHSVLVYPGTRGNNLITNDTFPYGMQWMYPCGGLGTTNNRTYWPTTDGPDGGPPNMSNIMLKPFMLLGPSNNPYPGTVCLPQVPLPVGATVKAGDKATIQVVELAQHGAALYSVSLQPYMTLFSVYKRLKKSLSTDTIKIVCRHHLRRTRRPPHPHRQRDKLLQLDAIRLRPDLHRHHKEPRSRCRRLDNHFSCVAAQKRLGGMAAAGCWSDSGGPVVMIDKTTAFGVDYRKMRNASFHFHFYGLFWFA
ncbi:hypothetical protein GGI43DRAFT_56569 [Trichoderma evansii]